MVEGLQTSFLRKCRRCQQIKAWLGFTVQGLGTAWIFFSLAVSVSMARDCMSSSSTVRLTLAPLPTRAVARGTRRKFYTASVYSSSLLPWLERLSYCLEYMSFSRFQYELLVHTPNTDVYRRILECRFTHLAPYVA